MKLRSLIFPLIALTLIGCRKSHDSAVPLGASTPPPILLFVGTGTSDGDVTAIEQILSDQHLGYSVADSAQVNDMADAKLRNYRLLIIPGGHYIHMGESLTAGATTKIHDAVQNGTNYLGICAGGLLAGNPPHNGINLTGVRFDFYRVVNQGIMRTNVLITGNGTPTLDQYWESGPQFTGWGEVVGKYPDGTPAVVQGTLDKGWIILSGIHPEAPDSWRGGMTFSTPAQDDNAYAAKLIHAALDGTRLPHF